MGKGIEETAPDGVTTVITHLRDYKPQGRAEYISADVLDKTAMARLFEKYKFDAVVHCAGIANVDYVEQHPDESRHSNLEGTRNIVELCREYGAYLVYVSTNAVFDGNDAPYSEDAHVNPINRYGQIKVECETLTVTELEECAVIRPTLMYGWNHPQAHKNPVSLLVETLRAGKPLKLVDDVYENPVYNIQCGRVIWRMLETRPWGVVHIAGKDTVSRYEFGLKVAEVFGLDKKLISPAHSDLISSIAPCPPNTSLITSKMETELGIEAMCITDALEDMRANEPK